MMTEQKIGVDCQFEIDGTLRVRRIFVDGCWTHISQGRQWVDQLGRHVMVMLDAGQAHEILLRPDTMTWSLLPLGGGYQTRLA